MPGENGVGLFSQLDDTAPQYVVLCVHDVEPSHVFEVALEAVVADGSVKFFGWCGSMVR